MSTLFPQETSAHFHVETGSSYFYHKISEIKLTICKRHLRKILNTGCIQPKYNQSAINTRDLGKGGGIVMITKKNLLKDVAYEKIKEKILRGDDEYTSENSLVNELQMSRTPIREAL